MTSQSKFTWARQPQAQVSSQASPFPSEEWEPGAGSLCRAYLGAVSLSRWESKYSTRERALGAQGDAASEWQSLSLVQIGLSQSPFSFLGTSVNIMGNSDFPGGAVD